MSAESDAVLGNARAWAVEQGLLTGSPEGAVLTADGGIVLGLLLVIAMRHHKAEPLLALVADVSGEQIARFGGDPHESRFLS